MDLTRTFPPEQVAEALGPWAFLGLDGLDPWFCTAFGDVFLLGDGGVYWLDIAAGELTRPFGDAEEAQRVLATDDGMDEYLMADLAFAAEEAGLEPGADQVLAFKLPPVLEGEFAVANVEVAPFVTAVRAAGELHHRVKDLPDGAEVDD